ncbi:hypothetical protein LINPERPRIM_LOCUS16734 [Linum perenne]
MERGSAGGGDLQSLLEAIKSSDVVEKRIQLLAQLGDLELREKSELASLVDCLSTFWEDYTCLDASQCVLNKTIVHVAAKFVGSDSSECLPEFLSLATKASSWCGKHLKMTLMSTDESQEEEHCQLFFQLLLEFLGLSTANILCLTRNPLLSSKESVFIVENFIREVLNLIKDVIPEIKRMNSLGPELLKGAQTAMDALMNLCKGCEAVPGSTLLLLGRIALFHAVLSHSADFDEDMKIKLAKKLGWFLDVLVNVDIYSYVLTLQVPVSISDVDLKTLKFVTKIIQNLKNPKDEMEKVVMELHSLFISGQAASDSHLHQCKPHLALFMGGLGEMQLSEDDDCAKSSAVWELYHMLLKERHWALAHLAIASFGYFAARTSCAQLWRFVPQDAALSYDVMSASETSEERFMSELKAVLEKEGAVLTIAVSSQQHELLVKEGTILREIVHRLRDMHIEEGTEPEVLGMEVGGQCRKRRKLPDGISRGVELLQDGLKVIGDGLSQWRENLADSTELEEKFLTHYSRLEDVISNLTGLAGSG